MISVEELYTQFCLSTDYKDIDHPYLSEETNYMLAFENWIRNLTAEELDDVTEEELELVKRECSKFVESYLEQHSKVVPLA